jgi:hypothetical protein
MRHRVGLSAVGWLLTAVMLLSLAGCALGGASTSSGSATVAATDSSAPTPSQPAGSATLARTPRRASPGPLQTVERYWRAIANHDFTAAYRDLAPGANPQSQATFVSAERQSDIQSATFSGDVTATSKTTATVAVDSLTTTDASYGCRIWSGSYQMTRLSGRWRIAQASITPSPCRGTGTTDTAGDPVSTGATNTAGHTATTGTTSNTGNTGNTGAGCSPLSDSGSCYEPGEYCRDSDHGMSGVAGDGETITCEDNNGWRWEPT